MMDGVSEIEKLQSEISAWLKSDRVNAISLHRDKLSPVLDKMEKAFSGSWHGYHSRVYFSDFDEPPRGFHFDSQRGLKTHPLAQPLPPGAKKFQEYSKAEIEQFISSQLPGPVFDSVELDKLVRSLIEEGRYLQATTDSVLSTLLAEQHDRYLSNLCQKIVEFSMLSPGEIVQSWSPSGRLITSDAIVVNQGLQVPIHVQVRADFASFDRTVQFMKELATTLSLGSSHLQRKETKPVLRTTATARPEIASKVFIGHGRSLLWWPLNHFIKDDLGVQTDEFNGVPIAGRNNQDRLTEMLGSAAMAFLVMTAEDETAEGDFVARMNVVHEIGLFQGHLGFKKAIILREEGCKLFSNIDGLGYIPFQKGNIESAFEQVRKVIKREGLM